MTVNLTDSNEEVKSDLHEYENLAVRIRISLWCDHIGAQQLTEISEVELGKEFSTT